MEGRSNQRNACEPAARKFRASQMMPAVSPMRHFFRHNHRSNVLNIAIVGTGTGDPTAPRLVLWSSFACTGDSAHRWQRIAGPRDGPAMARRPAALSRAFGTKTDNRGAAVTFLRNMILRTGPENPAVFGPGCRSLCFPAQSNCSGRTPYPVLTSRLHNPPRAH